MSDNVGGQNGPKDTEQRPGDEPVLSQSLVVWAINEGRGAAREVDRWLMGETSLP